MNEYVIGIDEAGRGPLAGPVFVAAVAIPRGFYPRARSLPFRDSKQLTENHREQWMEYFLTRDEVYFSYSFVSPAVIDKINISKSGNLAAFRAYNSVAKKLPKVVSVYKIYLDGNLYLKSKEYSKNHPITAETVIKGDEKLIAVRAASIVAKVLRDRKMRLLARDIPEYGFERHKGYGTREHRETIAKLGASEAHRNSFLKNILS